MVEAPCLDNSHESMCELQPAALQDSPISSAAQERSTSALGSSMVLGFVSRLHLSLSGLQDCINTDVVMNACCDHALPQTG